MYAQDGILGCGWRQPPDALSCGILEGGWIYSVVSFPPWLHGHVLNESSEASHPPSHS